MTIGTALQALEVELQRQTAELSGPMLEVCRYATQGGRRIRAALLLGAGQQFGADAVRGATAIEMIHAATLLQDDIFDSGLLRRGRTAAHVQFGKAMTILASDWLLIRSLEMAASFHPRFFQKLARAGIAMAQAEAQELEPPVLLSVEQVQQYGCMIAQGKTAVLFETAMCGAAVLQGLSDTESQCWEEIGMRLGLTYQLVDDCVDVYGTEAAAGKSVDVDLTTGCLTLPVLLAVKLLEQRGTRISLEAFRAGHICTADMLELQSTVHSEEVKLQLRGILERRLTKHRSEVNEAGICSSVLNGWFTDLETKLCMCSLQTSKPLDQASAGEAFLCPETHQCYA